MSPIKPVGNTHVARTSRKTVAGLAMLLASLAMSQHALAQSCGAGDTRYVIGASEANTATTAALTWTTGSLTRPAFTFASGFNVTLSFTSMNFLRSASYPAIGNLAGVNSLEVYHNNSTANADLHTMQVVTNMPTSAMGVRLEDLDFSSGQFRDRFTSSAGVTYTPVVATNYTISGDSIQSNNGVACNGTANCNVRASWGAAATGTTRTLTYQNGRNSASGVQATAYNDFVFCVPRTATLTLRKAWAGAVVNDDATVTASRGATVISTLNSNADSANETDAVAAVTVFQGETLALAETLAGTNVGAYNSALACTGTTDGNPSDGLTIGATDSAIVCTFTNTRRRGNLSITKTNNTTQVTSGTSTTYTLVVTNTGPDSVTGAVVRDTPGAGLACPPANPVTCTPAGNCPAGPLTVGNLTSGITLPVLANGAMATLSFSCNVQ